MAVQSAVELSAGELAERIRAGEVSSREVVEEHISRIEAVNERLNAVVIPLFDEALAQATQADEARARGDELGPLHGVPITIKEQFLVAGTDTTWGLRHRVGIKAESDGPLVACLRRAGAIILGKTNVPQLLLAYESDNDVYGRCNNPWDLERSPGGSTGGEAAIIAAGGSPLGLGGDQAGSIRVPVHFCGINGLKPTSGRLTNEDTPTATVIGALFGQEAILGQPGPMARTVADLRLAMDVLVGTSIETPSLSVPPVPRPDPEAVSVGGLRVGMYTDSGVFPAAPAVRRAVEEASEGLRSRGAQVEPVTPPDLEEAGRLFASILTADGGAELKRALGGERPHHLLKGMLQAAGLPNTLRPPLAKLFDLLGEQRPAFVVRSMGRRNTHDYWRLTAERTAYRTRFLAALDEARLDAVICPPFGLPAVTHGSSVDIFGAASYALPYNVMGLPAGVVAATRVRDGEESDRPSSRDRENRIAREVERGSTGLPVGVQVVARHWREDIVLAVMAALEEHFRATPDYPARPEAVV